MFPEFITQEIGLEPTKTWRAGSPRKTPAGRLLQGCYLDSAWIQQYDFEGRYFFDGALHVLSEIQPKFEFLTSLLNSGGCIELQIQLSGTKNIGDVLNHESLSKFSELGVSLSLEVFPIINWNDVGKHIPHDNVGGG